MYMEYPKVSVLVPTYNRPEFLPLIIFNVNNYDYDKKKLTLEILDDGDKPLFKNEKVLQRAKQIIHPIKLKYTYDNKRHLTIGEKRNKLIKNADNNYFAFQDDDDIYFESYLKHSYEILKTNKCGLVGSPEMLFCFPYHDFQISYIKCPSKRQNHEATMFSTRKYVRSMGWFPKSSQGEGAKLVDFNERNVGKTDIKKVMCCVCHNNNTCKKDRFLQDKIEGNISEIHKKILGDIFNLNLKVPPSPIPSVQSEC